MNIERIKIVVVVIGLVLSLFLFKKAAGTLNIGKINIASYIMYLFLLQTYWGASLVYLGDRNHYTMKYIIRQDSFDMMFYAVWIAAVLMPLTMVVMYRLCRIDIGQCYTNYLEKPVEIRSEKTMFWIIASVGFVCCCFLLLYIIKIGYFPLLRLVRTPSGFDFGTERQRISNIVIINSYVKNILIGIFIPLLSYVAFTYAITVKKLLWALLALVLIGASVVSATIDFEKSPVVFYLFVLLLIVMYVRGGLKRSTVVVFCAVSAVVIVFIYVRQGYDFFAGDSNFYNGPIGRTLFTQVGTLTMHFDLFPYLFPYLGGRSLSPTALSLLGIDDSHVRSAKLVMDYYGSEKVYDGTGGVMNAFYIGEAYANFGYTGMILSIIYMGILLGLLFYLFLRIRKNPYNLAITCMLTGKLALATQGGFTDFIYNFQTILLVLMIPFGHFVPIIWNKWIKPHIKGKSAKAVVKSS